MVAGQLERTRIALGSRAPGLWRVAVVAALVVSVVGALATWSAVSGLDDAHLQAVIARQDMDDVNAMLRARLDETVGWVGLDNNAPADDAHLEERLSLMVEDADDPGDVRRLADDVLAREAELRDDAAADGGPDERLVFGLDVVLGDLERAVVRPAADDTDAAASAARWTIAIGLAISTAVWLAAVALARAARQGDGSGQPGPVTARPAR